MVDLSTSGARRHEAPRRAEERKPGSVFRIVVICTGNRFRSPLVEGFIRQETRGLPVEVRSCGTLDLGPVPPLPAAVEGAAKLGLDISGHRSRALKDVDLDDADLVLGFERAHVARAVVDGGTAKDRTFTVLELVELLEAAPTPGGESVERARKAVELAAGYRRPRAGRPLPELSDPLNESARRQRNAVKRLHEISLELVEGLFGAGSALPAAAVARR
ncbi:MAG: arsenate-mycothiol transferase ArsC [Gaiellaceae bacterium]